jgi:ABC-2 type transport system permease protein
MSGRVRTLAVVISTMRLELQQLLRDRLYVALTMLAAVSFLGLVSLFGLTAADAPMALVVHDRGPYTRPFVEALVKVPHAFRLTRMTPEEAEQKIRTGDLVGAIVIPATFSADIASGATVAIDVEVDNVNVDIITDVQRALPAAIVGFGKDVGLPGLRVKLVEHDTWPRDTNFLPYITVSGLALTALIIAGVLGAIAIAREHESRTIKLWHVSPAKVEALLLGKLGVVTAVGTCAMALVTALVVGGYGVVPVHPIAAAVALVVCVVSFGSVGLCLGVVIRRTLVLLPLLFGLAMPLFIDSGALEPTRFDGETLWKLAHLTPLYYATGILQWAFFGLRITPESPWVDLGVLASIGAVAFAIARWRCSAAHGYPRTRLA